MATTEAKRPRRWPRPSMTTLCKGGGEKEKGKERLVLFIDFSKEKRGRGERTQHKRKKGQKTLVNRENEKRWEGRMF